MRNMEQQGLIDRLARVFTGFPEVEAVYLFGSWAKGSADRESDLDLALVTSQPLGSKKLDILTALTAEGIDNVDLATLDTDDVVLRFEAVSPNRLVYARAGFDHGSYYSRVIREYFDFLPYLERQRAAMKRRLTGGQG
jgi:predicted nucleotidyltransferase